VLNAEPVEAAVRSPTDFRLRTSRYQALLEPAVLLLVLLLSLAAGAFIWTAGEMREGETLQRDQQWLLAFRVPHQAEQLLGGAATLQLAREVSALGSPWFLWFLVGAVAAVLMAMRQLRLALFIVVSTSTGAAFNTVLKHGFARARPDLVPRRAATVCDAGGALRAATASAAPSEPEPPYYSLGGKRPATPS
jgi:undecaprenyl-diphosphatase